MSSSLMSRSKKVYKFGGSSLANLDRILSAISIVKDSDASSVVVSAIGDTTDILLSIYDDIPTIDTAVALESTTTSSIRESRTLPSLQLRIESLRKQHIALLPSNDLDALAVINTLFDELAALVTGLETVGEKSPSIHAKIVGFGERSSAVVFAAQLSATGVEAKPFDARQLIVTDGNSDSAVVKTNKSYTNIRNALLGPISDQIIPVITGYIATSEKGVATTLGRSGSDYTATLVGAALDADEIHIFTDVEGIATADPRLVPEAGILRKVSFQEAAEMSHFGAKVLHPRTMTPAEEKNIPIWVRSSFNVEDKGTLISTDSETSLHGVKTVTTISDQSIVTISGRGMTGVPGVAKRIFEAAEQNSVSVAMVSQSSSEQTVSLVIEDNDTPKLVAALESVFANEITRNMINTIAVRKDVAVLSIIGNGMSGLPGTAGRLCSALGNASVNILAIAQGAAELSISVAIEAAQVLRAVRSVHGAFGLTHIVNLAVVGTGNVGAEFLRLVAENQDVLRRDFDLDLRLVALVTSKQLLLNPGGLDATCGATMVREHGEARPNDSELITKLKDLQFSKLVLVDMTAAETQPLHQLALENGIHVVTANKMPLSQSLDSYKRLLTACRENGLNYNYETTFGAGLPVLHTLQELKNTGDELLSVSGCLSGTLGALCSWLDDGIPLNEAVNMAIEKGYTEPDPRDDLSGKDVARKALIIGRSLGMPLEESHVDLDPFVPGLNIGLEKAVGDYTPIMAKRIAEASNRGEVLRYVAHISPASVTVSLTNVAKDSPIGSLRGPDNIFVFKTRRYHDYPLVIRGPGAGAEVTAAGVLGDVLKMSDRTKRLSELD